jgi:hypothetical protein
MEPTLTQKCPKCNSASTVPMIFCKRCNSRFLPPPFPLVAERPQIGFPCPKNCGAETDVVMSCSGCGHVFKPCDIPNKSPIIPCEHCGRPVEHHFVEKRAQRSTPLEGDPRGKILGIDMIYACNNGHTRVFGREDARA